MNYKKKTLILSIFIVISIQILLLINNKQKTSFRYFIWTIQDVSIGRLICISFLSGLLMSATINKTLNNNVVSYSDYEKEDKTTIENDSSINKEFENDSNEMPPERDLRDIQPTISVNYRVIKENRERETKSRSPATKTTPYQDDWSNNDFEW